jgi:hypothetical protein
MRARRKKKIAGQRSAVATPRRALLTVLLDSRRAQAGEAVLVN